MKGKICIFILGVIAGGLLIWIHSARPAIGQLNGLSAVARRLCEENINFYAGDSKTVREMTKLLNSAKSAEEIGYDAMEYAKAFDGRTVYVSAYLPKQSLRNRWLSCQVPSNEPGHKQDTQWTYIRVFHTPSGETGISPVTITCGQGRCEGTFPEHRMFSGK